MCRVDKSVIIVLKFVQIYFELRVLVKVGLEFWSILPSTYHLVKPSFQYIRLIWLLKSFCTRSDSE